MSKFSARMGKPKGKFKTPLTNAVERKAADACRWFLLCDNPATETMPHPIIPGGVPICADCAAKVRNLSR